MYRQNINQSPIRQIFFFKLETTLAKQFCLYKILVFTLSSIMSRNMRKLYNDQILLHFAMHFPFLFGKTHQ